MLPWLLSAIWASDRSASVAHELGATTTTYPASLPAAFATILAVAAGLTLAGASAISHDLYANVIARGRSNEGTEIRISEIATFCLGLLAIVSLLDDSDRAKQERLGFEAQRVRCETGIGAEGAASH